ncbi:3-isopropylmalate dehydratase small subunit [Schauerella aestuarii]|uniref:3-isopropylmalate dehydratase small subunit n=1 Tax=Schauerella aestuarii TaxID=2511204 RepID=UPI001368BEF7|nr:3-isopropylmalate dehydratase small subunit [Achromobacter aestuarii]MYZ44634.1 3-isopropylmalate dehydratase small subunit [Achromobacter aestuarii]
MSTHDRIIGRAAPLPINNVDTDQIMPKQFLRGIDKTGLAPGVFYDLRHDDAGAIKPDFVLNRPSYAGADILIAGANFGCGSSREHAVWGLLQFGIRAIVAPSFGEIFYSNAMNNRLMLVMLAEREIAALLAEAQAAAAPLPIAIDVRAGTVTSSTVQASFELPPRLRAMYLEGHDMIGATLAHAAAIEAFARARGEQRPWVSDVAGKTMTRLDGM